MTTTVPAALLPSVTVSSVTGLPPTVTRAGLTISSPMIPWDTFGTWTINASGTLTGAPWNKSNTWSGSGTLTLTAPTFTPPPAPPSGFTIPAFTQTSNTVTISVFPPCAYTITGPRVLCANGTQVTFNPSFPVTTSAAGTITMIAAAESDLACTDTVNLTITSTAPGTPTVAATIPLTRL